MQSLFELSPIVMAIVPLVIALTQGAKQVGMSGRFAPVVSVALSIGLVALTGVSWQVSLVQGVLAGLAASGLYSSKAVVQG